MVYFTLYCLVQGTAIVQAFYLGIDSNESIGQLKRAIKAKKMPEFKFFDAEMLKLWKVQVRNVIELNQLTLHDYDQLLSKRKISSYFIEKPPDKHIHIIVKPPKPIHFSLALTLEAGLLSEGGRVEYLGNDCIHKATIREGCLYYNRNQKYYSFEEFIRAVRGLKLDEIPTPHDFQSLKINGMTYWEVRDKIYKFVYYEKPDNCVFIDHFSIPWGDDLESRLRELCTREDIVDIFWGRSLKDDTDTTWRVYVVSRNICYLCKRKRTENFMGDQMIRFITEEEGFTNAKIQRRSPHDPLPTLKKIPKNLQKVFDVALDNELGQSFRKMHYNLVGMSTGYKHTQGKLTEVPAIILYVRQKGILRRGCDKFPDKIRGYPVDVVEACAATPCGLGENSCRSYQDNIKLGSSIGIIESQGTSGTLSAVVRDKNSNQIGILSCEHVCKFCESSVGTSVHQPSLKDLSDQRKLIDEMANASEAYRELSEELYRVADNHKQNSAIARYTRGMRSNFLSETHKKNFGIDAAFCTLTSRNRKLCPNNLSILPDDFIRRGLPGNTRLNGFYTYEELDSNDFDNSDIFKVGRATGLTIGKLILRNAAISFDLTNESIEYAKTQGVPVGALSNKDREGIFIGYMKSPLFEGMDENRQQCYPTVWFDRQLVSIFKPGDFGSGDSGANILDKKGKALGILHASWMTDYHTYGIASPYFAVFEALNVVEFHMTS